jgi:hypothetical protein
MAEREHDGVNRPDYSKYAGLEELPSGWWQFLSSPNVYNLGIVAIMLIALRCSEAWISPVAIVGIVGLGVVSALERRWINGATTTEPTQDQIEPRDVGGG